MNNLAALPGHLSDLSLSDLLSTISASAIITSVVWIGVLVFLRGVGIRYIRKDAEILAREQRQWIIRIKNASAALVVIGLIFIWAPQLHTFAISIAAFAVALVVATKEMILCLTGAIMRTISVPFKVGEWITIDGVTGEVIDVDAFAFHLQEVDMEGKTYQFTGRTITVPNSKLFSSNIENANFFKAYIFEDIRVAVQFNDLDPAAALETLKSVAEENFAQYRKDAIAFNRKIRRRAGTDIGSAEPFFDLTTSDLGHYHFHVRLFLPTNVAANVGASVSRDFLSRIYEMRQHAKSGSGDEETPASAKSKKSEVLQ